MVLEKTTNIAIAVGRRKEAIAQVQLIPGTGQFLINGIAANIYLQKNPRSIVSIDAPFKQIRDNFNEQQQYLTQINTIVKVSGGGLVGQADAIQLGVARALCEINEQFRKCLKDKGFLTQDSRIKERRKYGLKKARKAPQYHKR
jgi:small subunit ribosomal protein S9